MWPTIQLHGRQTHDYVVSITLVHSVTVHCVVSNNASIDVIIRLYNIVVRFSNELVNSNICPATHICVLKTTAITNAWQFVEIRYVTAFYATL